MSTQFKLLSKAAFILITGFVLSSCAPSAPQLKKVMEENPDILYSVIEKDPKKFLDVVQAAANKARQQAEQEMADAETKAREEEFKNPKKPEIGDDRAFTGSKEAPVTIVEYSDFQCPFCRRGHNTTEEILKAYPGKVKIVFKHSPIERIHPQARDVSAMYEAIAMQNIEKASQFKALAFQEQERLGGGEKVLEELAKKVGADVKKAKADMKSDAVQKRIDADKVEAESFGFTGTPGYLVNGVSLKGAYPFEEFKKIIDRQLSGS